MAIGNAAEVTSALFTAVGVVLGLWQLYNHHRVQRAEFLLKTTERYFSDLEVRRLYQDIDYRRFHLIFKNDEPAEVRRGDKQSAFLGSDDERLLDSLLYTFDTIGRIFEMGLLKKKEACVFAYQAKRVLDNSEVKRYLNWLNKERDPIGGEVPAHKAALHLKDLALECRSRSE